jgi:hypothetical protein
VRIRSAVPGVIPTDDPLPDTIANKSRSDIIKANFIGNRLDAFRNSFTSIYEKLHRVFHELTPYIYYKTDAKYRVVLFASRMICNDLLANT